MANRTIFDPSMPFTPKKRYSAPAPRSARTFARIMIFIFGLMLVAGVVIAIVSGMNDPLDWSDETALTKIESYRQQDMIDLNKYLVDHGYKAAGDSETFIYEKANRTIVISLYETEVRVGDGEGNSRQFGPGLGEIYLCRVSWVNETVDTCPLVALPEPRLRDISMSAEAVAETIRLANR